MNLTVEWVHFGDFVQGPGNDDYKPVIRVATLRKWLEGNLKERRYNNTVHNGAIDDLLAQLPEKGTR